MGQKKLVRFEAIRSFSNVLQYPESMAGNWKNYFTNSHPVTLELACGKGEYTVALAQMYPDRNFIGVDLKGNRLYIGAKYSLLNNIKNTAFLRTQIDKIDTYFVPDEVEEIWITFPDPQLRTSKARKRLTHPKFLRLYQRFLKPGGFIHLKTDSPHLYKFTKTVIDMYGLIIHQNQPDVYKSGYISREINIRTHYEQLDIAGSNKIHYLQFSLPSTALPNFDTDLQETIKAHEESID